MFWKIVLYIIISYIIIKCIIKFFDVYGLKILDNYMDSMGEKLYYVVEDAVSAGVDDFFSKISFGLL